MNDRTVFIFLDDVREPPDDKWIVKRTAEAAHDAIMEAITDGCYVIASLDHDLGEDVSTGYDLVSWLEERIYTDSTFRPRLVLQIHSANPVGRKNMEAGINSIARKIGQWG